MIGFRSKSQIMIAVNARYYSREHLKMQGEGRKPIVLLSLIMIPARFCQRNDNTQFVLF